MNDPLFNVEERIDKIVRRRLKVPDALTLANSRTADAIAWRKAFGGVRVPLRAIDSAPTKKQRNGYGG